MARSEAATLRRALGRAVTRRDLFFERIEAAGIGVDREAARGRRNSLGDCRRARDCGRHGAPLELPRGL